MKGFDSETRRRNDETNASTRNPNSNRFTRTIYGGSRLERGESDLSP